MIKSRAGLNKTPAIFRRDLSLVPKMELPRKNNSRTRLLKIAPEPCYKELHPKYPNNIFVPDKWGGAKCARKAGTSGVRAGRLRKRGSDGAGFKPSANYAFVYPDKAMATSHLQLVLDHLLTGSGPKTETVENKRLNPV